MSRLIDLTGQKFGYLTVIKRAEDNKFGNVQWLCRCDCGNEKVVTGSGLKRGDVRSCGCKTNEMFRKTIESKRSTRIGCNAKIIKNNTCDLDEAILNTLAELKRRRKCLKVTDEKQRLMYIITSAQIEILEALDVKYKTIGDLEYKEESEKVEYYE